MAKQEFISKTWLLQNIHTDMGAVETLQTIMDAPVVEFDADEVHELRRIVGKVKAVLKELMDT